MTLLSLFRRGEKIAVDNSPLILTAIGVIGTVTTAYLTGKASVKAYEILADRARQGHIDGLRWEYVKPKDKVELVWKEYIPPFVMGALTIAAIITSNRVSSRRAAALAVAYSLTERAFDEYKEKIVEKLGKSKEQAVRDEIAQDRIRKDPPGTREVLLAANGEVLCYDLYTGRYFQSDMETLRRAQNDINQQIIHEMSASLTDFYYKIGLKPTAISDEVGWNTDKMLELSFSAALSEDNKPCMAVGFKVSPIRYFYKIS